MLYPLSYGGYPQYGAVRAYLTAATVVPVPSVLVVDDTPSIRLLIRTNLEIEGFLVEEAKDGQECLDRLFGGDPLPDVLTIDIMMPRLDGLNTVHALRVDPRTEDLLIVMVTTQAQAADIERGRKAGIDAYVTKPFDPDHLVRTIKEVYEARYGKIR